MLGYSNIKLSNFRRCTIDPLQTENITKRRKERKNSTGNPSRKNAKTACGKNGGSLSRRQPKLKMTKLHKLNDRENLAFL